MVPLAGPAVDFDCMYHLRLLSVQYMSGERADALFQPFEDSQESNQVQEFMNEDLGRNLTTGGTNEQEDLLEAAMRHAHEVGVNHGVTRAMVIRAYPK